MDLLLGFVLAMSVTMVLIPPLMRVAGRARFLDAPENRKVHRTPVPRVGGIAMAVGVLLPLILLGHFDRQLQAFCVGLLILLAFGVWDDRATLGAGVKFLGQALAVLVAMLWGGVGIDSITLADRLTLPGWIATPLTFFFLIGVTNAINLADGLDGLAGGAALLCLGAVALLAFSVGNPDIGSVALVIAGAVLGFLRYNTHPASVFMGDCGSQILGFSVAVLSVVLTQDPQAPLSAALPLLLLGVPIMDTLTVMTRRMLAGRSPFVADRNHLHHRLLLLGLYHHEAVVLIYVAQSGLFLAAWFLRYQPDPLIVLVFAVFCAGMIGFLQIAAARGWQLRPQSLAGAAMPTRKPPSWLGVNARLTRSANYVIGIGVLGYAAGVLALGRPLSVDVRLLAAIAALILSASLLLRRDVVEAGWIDKCAIYLSAVIAVYINGRGGDGFGAFHYFEWAILPLLALAVLLRLNLPQERKFTVNPLDVLVIFLAIAVPNLPGSITSHREFGNTVAKLILLLYALELLGLSIGPRWRWLSGGALAFLVVCVVHGF